MFSSKKGEGEGGARTGPVAEIATSDFSVGSIGGYFAKFLFHKLQKSAFGEYPTLSKDSD